MSDPDSNLNNATARLDFEAAMTKGFWRSLFSWLLQRNNELLPFDEVRRALPTHGQHYIGMREIPLRQIVGSVGRYQDFDRVFLPRRKELRSRWVNIDKAHLSDIVLPPIDVYQLGSVYFVLDGNHRVSVARDRGQEYIDANVIALDVPFEVNENTNIDELIRKSEKAQFLLSTDIQMKVPDADIEFTLPGGYSRLDEHIRVHAYFMGLEQKRSVPFDEGLVDWYRHVYMPLVKVIRHYHILDQFPGRTEADLYLWIIEHLWYLRQEYGQEISVEQAATDFAEKYARQPWRAFVDIFRRAWLRIHGSDLEEKKDEPPSTGGGEDPHP